MMCLSLRKSPASRHKVIELELWTKLLLCESMFERALAIEHAVSELAVVDVLPSGGALGHFLNQGALAIEFIVSIITSER
jgi:hypothetical protein